MASPELVHRHDRGPVAVLTLDHPPVNVLSAPVLDELLARLADVDHDPGVRAVVLSGGEAKAFAAGADIREMGGMGPSEAQLHGARGQSVTRAIERLPVPVIAAVHGACLGGGCEIVLACDLVLASEEARFGQPEINLGVMPGWGGTQRLPRRIGAQRAREWILTGQTVSAGDAERLGLVLRVMPRGELLPGAIALAEELAGKSATALAAAKRVLANAIDRELDRGLERELAEWAALFGTPDQRAGMAAFLAKSPWTPERRTRTEGRAAAEGKAKN